MDDEFAGLPVRFVDVFHEGDAVRFETVGDGGDIVRLEVKMKVSAFVDKRN